MLNGSEFINTLRIMGVGMAGIFLVIFTVYLLILLLNKLLPGK